MFVFFKQKTAYEMRISDWSSDVCSSDLADQGLQTGNEAHPCALAARQLRYLDARPRAAAIRDRGAEGRVSQPDRARRNPLVPGLFGAGLGQRPRFAPDFR